MTTWVVIGIALCAFAGSAAHAAAIPLFRSADEVGHFDYALQVWHGHLPDFFKGLEVDQLKGSTMPVQWVAQHPPLFYLILAPVVGPLTDAGHILIAGMAARMVNVLIGTAVPLAVVWAVSRAFPGRTEYSLLSGLVAATSPWLHGVAGAIYNDALAALLATIVIGVTCNSLRHGSTARRWVLFSILSSAALLTRLSLIVVVLVCLAAMMWRTCRAPRSGPATALAAGAATVLLILATSGWFYWRNIRTSGSITGGHPEWSAEHLGRRTRSLSSLLHDPTLFPRLLGLFWDQTHSSVASFMLVLVPAVIAVTAFCLRLFRGYVDGATIVILVLFSIVSFGTAVMQVKYAMGGGAVNPRYSLPILLPLSFLVAYGLLVVRRLRVPLVATWTGSTVLLTVTLTTVTASSGANEFPNLPGISAVTTIVYLLVVGGTAALATAVPDIRTLRGGSSQGSQLSSTQRTVMSRHRTPGRH